MKRSEFDFVDWYLRDRAARGKAAFPDEQVRLQVSIPDSSTSVGEMLSVTLDSLKALFRTQVASTPRASIAFTDTRGERGRRWSDKAAKAACSAVDARLTDFVTGSLEPSFDDDPYPQLYFELRRNPRQEEYWDLTVSWAPSRADLPTQAVDVADVMLGVLRQTAVLAAVSWAGCWYDWWCPGDTTPFERWYGMESFAEPPRSLPRGYYWVNVLTPQHVEEMGGMTAVAGTCDDLGVRLEELSAPDPALEPRYLLIAAADPVHMSEDQTARIKQILEPLLSHPPYQMYWGGPLRIVRDKGTAWYKAGPDEELPYFEDGRPNKVPHRPGGREYGEHPGKRELGT